MSEPVAAPLRVSLHTTISPDTSGAVWSSGAVQIVNDCGVAAASGGPTEAVLGRTLGLAAAAAVHNSSHTTTIGRVQAVFFMAVPPRGRPGASRFRSRPRRLHPTSIVAPASYSRTRVLGRALPFSARLLRSLSRPAERVQASAWRWAEPARCDPPPPPAFCRCALEIVAPMRRLSGPSRASPSEIGSRMPEVYGRGRRSAPNGAPPGRTSSPAKGVTVAEQAPSWEGVVDAGR